MILVCNHCQRSRNIPAKRIREPAVIYCPYCHFDMREAKPKKRGRRSKAK